MARFSTIEIQSGFTWAAELTATGITASISSDSTDSEIPTAKAVYDYGQSITPTTEWTLFGSYSGSTIVDVSSLDTGCSIRIDFECRNIQGSGSSKELDITINGVSSDYNYVYKDDTTLTKVTSDGKMFIFRLSTTDGNQVKGSIYTHIGGEYNGARNRLGFAVSNFTSTEGYTTQHMLDGFNSDIHGTRVDTIEFPAALNENVFKIYYRNKLEQ